MNYTLKVAEAQEREIHCDTIRVNKAYRRDRNGSDIEIGKICKVSVGKKWVYAILRGNDIKGAKEFILIDYVLRQRLDVDVNESYDFTFEQVGLLGTFLWMWDTTDVGFKVSSRIAIVGFVISVISLIPVLPSWAHNVLDLFSK